MNKRFSRHQLESFIFILLIIVCIFNIGMISLRNWKDMSFESVLIASTDVFCMLHITVFYAGIINARNQSKKMLAFLNWMLLIFFTSGIDLAVIFCKGVPALKNLLYVLYVIFVFALLCCSLSMLGYTNRVIKGRNEKYQDELIAIGLVVGALTLFYCFNFKHNLLFSVDENTDIVVNKPWGYLYLYASILMQGLSVSMAISSKVPKKQKPVIIFYNVIPFIVVGVCSTLLKSNFIVAGLTVSMTTGHNAFYNDLERSNSTILKTFERFLSDDIVDQLVKKDDGSFEKPQVKMATIMNCDIRGFTAISQRLFPSKLVDMINHYFGVVTEIIENNEGVILEFLGDGFTASFGAPTYVKNFPEKAVSAAIQIQNSLDNINEWNRKMGYPELQVGIGINTGEITLGSFGSRNKAVFKAIGEEADFANYIESLSFGGSILISRSTLDEIKCENDARRIYHLDEDEYNRENDIYYIKKLGEPYNVEARYREYSPKVLDVVYPCKFHVFTNKKREETEHLCEIIELSENHIKIRTDVDLSNVREVDFSDRNYNYIYAKIIHQEGNLVELTFTSKPSDFKKWYTKIINYHKQKNAEN